MTKKEILLTSTGLQNLKNELLELKTIKRPAIVEAIKDARAQGDLSENAEYQAARNEQSELETRINKLEYIIENAKLIENKSHSIVEIGSNVTIEYIDDKTTEEYIIVSSLEANPFENRISDESPIGLAIINKKVGDKISVESPTGSYKIKIIKID